MITDNIENEYDEKEYRLKSIKKAQNFSAVALFLMMTVGFGMSTVLPDVSFFTSGASEQAARVISAVYNGVTYCLYVGTPILFMLVAKLFGRKEGIGFTKRLPPSSPAVIGFCLGVMYFANVLANIISLYMSSVGMDLPDSSSAVPFQGWLPLLITVFTGAVLPAFLEEMLMRGFIMGGMAKFDKRTALVVSSLLFGIMHLNPIQNLFAVIAGFVMGYFVLKSNSLWIGVIVHFLNNFIAIVKNTMNASAESDIRLLYGTLVIDVLIFVIGTVSAVYLAKKDNLFSNDAPKGRMLFTLSDALVVYIALATVLSYMQISF